MLIVHVGTHDYGLYILEQPSSWSISRIRPSWPRSRLRLSLLLVSLLNVFLVWYGPSSILLFVTIDRVSHQTPSLLSGRLLTNVQVNNITTLHDTHIYITSALLFFFPFYTSSTLLAGWLVQTLPVWHKYIYNANEWNRLYILKLYFTHCLSHPRGFRASFG
jgi:hypothetical protein